MAYETTAELAQYTEKELGHRVDTSTQRDQIITHLDRFHKIICAGSSMFNTNESGKQLLEPVFFSWAESQNAKVLILQAPHTSGFTCAINNGSTSLTLSADPSSGGDLSGWYLRINTNSEIYRISSHVGTAVTLDAAYVGDNVSGVSGKIFKLDYDLGSDILTPLGEFRGFKQNLTIPIVGRNELRDQYPLRNVSQGYPQMAALLRSDDGTFTYRFSHYPENQERLELDYIPTVSTLDTSSVDPIIPKRFRLILAHATAYFMLRRNSDSKAATHLRDAQEMFMEMKMADEQIRKSGDPDYGRIRLELGSASINNLEIGDDVD